MAETTQLRVFVSHASEDSAFCRTVVKALREAGADVWYDEDDMGNGQLMSIIQPELSRPIFVVILSKAAFASKWVKRETTWAYEMTTDGDPSRVILPVTAGPIERDDFSPQNEWLFLRDFRRIEAPNYQPYAPDEAARRVLHALALTPAGQTPASVVPQPTEGIDDLLTRGKALAKRKQYAGARLLLERATQIAPGSFSAWANLGNIFNGLKLYRKALDACERALALNGKQAWVWSNKGVAFNGLKRYDEALDACNQALSFYDELAEAWVNKGIALNGLTHYAEALKAFDQASELAGEQAWVWSNKGAALNGLTRYDEALMACDQALSFDPNLTEAWANKGVALGGLGRTEEANHAYSQALGYNPGAEWPSQRVFNPNDARDWNSVAAILVDRMGLYEHAVATCDKALFIDPNYAMAWNNRGIALRNLGRNDDAIATYKQALKINSGLAEAWNNWGVAFDELKRYVKALHCYNRALKINPNFVAAWGNKANALRALGRDTEAEAAEQRANELDE